MAYLIGRTIPGMLLATIPLVLVLIVLVLVPRRDGEIILSLHQRSRDARSLWTMLQQEKSKITVARYGLELIESLQTSNCNLQIDAFLSY